MQTSTDKIRVGVIGVGYLGRFHAQKFAAMPDAELVGVVDVDPSQSRAVAKRLGTRAFNDHEELFGRVDAVSIVTPTPAHFPVARACLAHDIDVMMEKPITTTVAEAEALIQLAENRGRLIQVGHLERFNPAFTAALPEIHEPRFIESRRVSTYQPRGTDVSVILDLMIHDIDLVLSLAKAEVSRLRAGGMTLLSKHLDMAGARLEFANGCVANILASRIAPRSERVMQVFQDDAHISIDFGNHETAVVKKGEAGTASAPYGADAEIRSVAKGDALKDELTAFVRTVRTRETPVVSGETGRDALKTALAIASSIHTSVR